MYLSPTSAGVALAALKMAVDEITPGSNTHKNMLKAIAEIETWMNEPYDKYQDRDKIRELHGN